MQMSVIESLTCAWAASFFFLLFCGRPSRLHKVRNRDGIFPAGNRIRGLHNVLRTLEM
jgi:hypothetical protein